MIKRAAETIVDAIYASWRVRDVDTGLAYCSDDIHVIFHFGPGRLFSGESRGKEQARCQLVSSGEDWDFLEMSQVYTFVSRDLVRCSRHFVLRHRRSRMLLEGTLRHDFKLRDGLICYFEAFIDVAYVASFLHLLGRTTRPLPSKVD